MTRNRWTKWMAGVALAAGFAVPALAEERRAVVVAGTEEARADAVIVSEALLGLGFEVDRLEAPDGDALTDALAGLSAVEGPAVVYLSGADHELADAIGADAGPRFVFVDDCEADLAGLPENVLAVCLLYTSPSPRDA